MLQQACQWIHVRETANDEDGLRVALLLYDSPQHVLFSLFVPRRPLRIAILVFSILFVQIVTWNSHTLEVRGRGVDVPPLVAAN